MAVDTQDKRRSVIGILPIPDSDINQADRQQLDLLYRGILSIQLLGEVFERLYNVPSEDRVYVVPDNGESIFNVLAEDRIYEVG